MSPKNAIFIALYWLFVLCVSSCSSKENNELRDKQNAHKRYINLSDRAIINGNLEIAICQIDSVFRSIKNPNNWDKQYFYGACMWMYKEVNKNELALKYVDSNIAVLQKINNKQLTTDYYSSALLQKGIIHFKLGNYNDAYNNFFEAKRILNFLEDSCLKLGPLNSYAMVLYQQKEYKLAKDAFLEELHVLKTCYKNGDPKFWDIEQILDNIGLCYTKMNELDSAKKYYLSAIEILEKGRPTNRTMNSEEQKRFNINFGVRCGNLAKVYIKSQPDSAIYLYKKAISLNEKGTSELADAQLCMYQLANVQLQQKLYSDAFVTLNKLRRSLDTAANTKAELGYKENLLLYFEATNQYKQAFATQKNYETFKDSIQKKEAGINTTNINKELKDREQQLQIKLLQKDKNINQLYLLIGGIALLLVGVIAILLYKNFTKSKKQNQQLIQFNNEIKEEQQKTAIALQKLEVSNQDKDRIMNIVAHDLRNPIGAIANFLEMIQVKYEHGESENKMLESSKLAATRSLHLINDLLETNRLPEDNLTLVKTKVDVISMIDHAIDEVRYKAINKQQQLIFNSSFKNVVVKADSEKIKRVIINLLDNAIKFSHLHTTIVVECIVQDLVCFIKVKDSGIGIPENIKQQLFKSGIAIKRKGTTNEPSNGLGLSIAAAILKEHGGNLSVTSKEYEGSIFTIELPMD